MSVIGRDRITSLLIGTLAGILAGTLGACGDPGPTRAALSVAGTLTDTDTAGYARATTPRPLEFPRDHGPHLDYKHEWWYFTGTLTSEGGPASEPGREFGFQLTFFRVGLRPDPSTVESAWAANQAYMAHFAVTDLAAREFHAFERIDRAALGLAGAEASPPRVWVGDWTARAVPDGASGAAGVSGAADARPEQAVPGAAFRIRATERGMGIDLVLRPTQPIVLQGEGGLSRKGPEPGNASYYYSMMRLDARGTVLTGGARHPVRGEAWLDREWGTSALAPGTAGWDWLSLQLDDDSELMLYRLRTHGGGTAPFSAGTFVAPDGAVTRLGPDDFSIEPTGSWTSPRGGRYPSGWRVRVPRLDLLLEIEPRLPDQEPDLTFRYWEGAVAATGRRAGQRVAAKGYVELTGYGDPAPP